jgi:hypothetical protein
MDPRRRFERAAFLWITLPILLVALMAAIFFLATVATAGGGRLGTLAQLATVMLAGILLAAGAATIVFCVAAARGVNRLVVFLPPRTRRIRRATAQAAMVTARLSDFAVQPVIYLAGLRAMGRGFADGVRDLWKERRIRHG